MTDDWLEELLERKIRLWEIPVWLTLGAVAWGLGLWALSTLMIVCSN